jgi:hypothetical protein
MPANTVPIFPLTQNVSFTGNITTANIAKDGTGTVNLLFTAGANGSRIDQIKVRPLGTNVATVMRFFVNNGSDPTTAANNTLVHEKAIAATTLNEALAMADNDVTIIKNTTETACPIPYLPATYRLYVTIGTTVAAGLQATAWGADY